MSTPAHPGLAARSRHAFAACACAVLCAAGTAFALTPSGARDAAQKHPARSDRRAGRVARARALAAAREFLESYLPDTDGAQITPPDASETLQRTLAAYRPAISPAQRHRRSRLAGLTVLEAADGMRVRAAVDDGEGVRFTLLLQIASSRGRLVVAHLEAGQ